MVEQPTNEITLLQALTSMVNELRPMLDDHNQNFAAIRVDLAEIRSLLEVAAEERQAMRQVIDSDLAGHGQVLKIEGQVEEVARAVRRLERTRV